MHVINLAGATSVQDHDGNMHEANAEGVFTTLPLDFARELVTQHASHWREPSAHEAAQRQAHVEELRNPHVLPGVVAELRDRLARAEVRIDELEAAAKAKPAASGARKAPAKKTAAKPDQPPAE
jgi:hypothetical protein